MMRNDNYCNDQIIYESNSSIIFKAISQESCSKVILKQLSKMNLSFDENVQNEMDIHYTLEHPNILICRRCFEDDYYGFLEIEYCEHADLLSYFMKQNYSFSNEFIKQILFQSALGLEYIFQQGFIHNHIQPDNLFLNGNFIIKIGDFGQMIQIDSTSIIPSLNLKSTCFLPPETLRGKCLGMFTDIWALGATLYYFIENEFPFQGEDRLNPRKMMNQSIDIKVKNMVLWMLENDPMERPSFQQIKDFQIPFFKNLKYLKLNKF
jgi:serine/threonine protein kinase